MIIIDDDGVMHKVLPIDTLDKIRAEIEELKLSFFDNERTIDAVLSIIDKYRREQE